MQILAYANNINNIKTEHSNQYAVVRGGANGNWSVWLYAAIEVHVYHRAESQTVQATQ